MKTELPAHLQQIIDEVCLQGCQQVKSTIAQLQQDGSVNTMRSLTKAERSAVLVELQTIMAVYNK